MSDRVETNRNLHRRLRVEMQADRALIEAQRPALTGEIRRQIVDAWARGADVQDLARKHRLPMEVVDAVVRLMANLSRARKTGRLCLASAASGTGRSADAGPTPADRRHLISPSMPG